MKTLSYLWLSVVCFLSVFSYVFVDRNAPVYNIFFTTILLEHRGFVSFVFLLLIISLYIIYLLLMKNVKLFSVREMKIMIIGTCVILFFSYPVMLSFDVFNYATTAKVLFYYKENPYIVMPIDFLQDPNLEFTRAANKIALYGPLWISITGIPFLFSANFILLFLLNLKLLLIAWYLGIVFILYKLSGDIKNVMFFSFNPLVIIETLISAHNDIVMMGLVIFSYYLLKKKKKLLLSSIFFVCSFFIKYATIALSPVFLYILYSTIKNKKINWENQYVFSALVMTGVFCLAPFREEFYPWYAIWFLVFVSLINNKKIFFLSHALSFGLLIRYLPYIYSGSYFGYTMWLKEVLTFFPLIGMLFYWIMKRYVIK